MKNFIKLILIALKSTRKYGLTSGIQLILIAFKSIFSKFPFSPKIPMRYLGFEINAPSPRLLLALINEIFINEEYLFAARYVNKPNPFIIDAGANIGVSLLYWKKRS